MSWLLLFIIFMPLSGSLLCLCIRKTYIKEVSFFISIVIFLCSLLLWVFFDNSSFQFQFVSSFAFLKIINCHIRFGIDGFSLFFILLITFLFPLCFLFFWNKAPLMDDVRWYYSSFLILECFLLIVFLTLDLVVFYLFFESVLVPIFFIIGVWGSRNRKVRSSFLFFLYTLLGSLFILLAIIFIFLESGTTDYLLLLENSFSVDRQKVLWFAFFLSFSIKVPIVPFHLWLPEAHVEAPTGASVILAAVLLKLGAYGFIRFSIPLFPLACIYFRPFVFILSILGAIYISIIALRQSDLKRIIAYGSISHINLTILGVFSFSFIGLQGSLFQIISHGIVSGGLFFCVGVLYDRFHTRLLQYYSGLVHTIPVFITFFLIFTIANIGLPGTGSFVGELLVLCGIFFSNSTLCFFSCTTIVFSACYGLWLFNRISYGNIKLQFISFSKDLSFSETFTFFPLIFLVIFIGLFPSFILEAISVSCFSLLKQII